ncbi:MAG: heme ABC exporter ATP-binding protein CcmA [Anaerolineae bacterium]|nr:heme ABC exporter ATP-binding protein CcmA [Anaerolineae bacterium]
MIEVRGLVKAFGMLPVLRGLDLTVERGTFVALLGPNGSGKTTLMRILAALSKPTAGEVRIGGWSLPAEADAVRAQLGVVAHQPLLYGGLTARENLNFFCQLYSLPPAARRPRVEAVLDRVGLLPRADDEVRTFSRGMQQRLAIARAILHDPHVLLFDEPYTGLDQDAGAMLDGLLQDVAADGHTIIMTSHDLARARDLSTHVAILSRGKVGHFGRSEDIRPDDFPALYASVTGAASVR